MIWVTWRQHRPQAIAMAALFCALTVFAVVLGAWMRSAFSADGLGACLAHSGGSGCAGTITSFVTKFNGRATIPVSILLTVIPGYLGAVVGAPLLGQELERGTWQLAWSQTVPRTRWLVTKLALVAGALVAVRRGGHRRDDLVPRAAGPGQHQAAAAALRLRGAVVTCSLLCAFALAVLAGLLLRNIIAAMVVGYLAWEVPFVVVMLLNDPLHILSATARFACRDGCPGAGTNSVPPVTGNLGDLVLDVTHSGRELVVTYLPASRFWTLQLIEGGLYLAIAAAALGTAVWLLHRRTT